MLYVVERFNNERNHFVAVSANYETKEKAENAILNVFGAMDNVRQLSNGTYVIGHSLYRVATN